MPTRASYQRTDRLVRPRLSMSTSIRRARNFPAGTSTSSSLIALYLKVEVTVPPDTTSDVQVFPGLGGSCRTQYGASYTVPRLDRRNRPLSVTRTWDWLGPTTPSDSRPTVTSRAPSFFSTAVTTSVNSEVWLW